MKKNAIRTLIAVSTASLALVAAGPATAAAPPEPAKQTYEDVPPSGPFCVTIQFDPTGSIATLR